MLQSGTNRMFFTSKCGYIAFDDYVSDLGQYFIPSENARYPGWIVLRKDKAAFSRVFVFN